MKKFLILGFLFLIFAAPSLASAHNIGIPYWGGAGNPILSCTGNPLDPNDNRQPCTSVCDIFHTLQHVIYFGISLVLFVLAPIMFLAGGIMVVLGGANASIISKGRSILWGTVIGVAVALGSFLIVATFLWLVGNNPEGSGKPRVKWPQIECNPSDVPGYPPGGFRSGYEPTSGPDFTTTSTAPVSTLCNPRCVPPQVCSVQNSQYVCINPAGPAPTGTTPSVSNCNGGQGCTTPNTVCTKSSGGTYFCQLKSDSCRGLPGGRLGCPMGKVCVSGFGSSVCVDAGGP